jgi:hypothetical protein
MAFKAAGRLKPMHPLHKGRFTPLSRSSELRAMSRLSGGGREVFPTAVCFSNGALWKAFFAGDD